MMRLAGFSKVPVSPSRMGGAAGVRLRVERALPKDAARRFAAGSANCANRPANHCANAVLAAALAVPR